MEYDRENEKSWEVVGVFQCLARGTGPAAGLPAWAWVFGAALVLAAGWLWLIGPKMRKKPDLREFRRFDYAHRGLHNLENGVPENSLRALALAELAGYGMEFDVQLTKDKQVVVHHDHSIQRSCGADRNISEMTYEELRQYRLFGTEEPVPLLREVLAALDGRTPLIVELKDYNDPAELCALTMKELENCRGLYCVESFDPRIVRWFRQNRPELVRGQLMCRFRKGDGGMTAWQALCARNLLTNWYTRPHFEAYDIHTRDIPAMWAVRNLLGMQEVSWTIRSLEEYERAKALGNLCIFEHILPAGASGDKRGSYQELLDAAVVALSKRTAQGKR